MRQRNGHKYGAVKTVIDGYTFASKAEARRFAELRLLEKAGKIESLELQPVFVLKAPLTTGTVKGALKASAGELPTIGKYVGDFRYFRLEPPTGWILEDVKSPATRTPMYRWKIKHLKAQYGIEVVEVMSR